MHKSETMIRWLVRAAKNIRKRIGSAARDTDAETTRGGNTAGHSTESQSPPTGASASIAATMPIGRGRATLTGGEARASGHSREGRSHEATTATRLRGKSDDGGWITLTDELPRKARKGDVTEIVKWLTNESIKRKYEIVVWINRTGKRPRAEAGTSQQATKTTLPKWLRDKLKDPLERNEIWHNHPAGPGVPSIAAPGPEDIAVATLPGVAAVSAVDDGANTMKVTPTDPRFGRADVIVDWTRKARDLMRGRLLMERIRLELPLDEEATRTMTVRIAEATVGAAVAAGLIHAQNLSETGILDGRELAAATNNEIGTPAERTAKALPRAASAEWLSEPSAHHGTNASRETKRWR